jgi:hypothetical protein
MYIFDSFPSREAANRFVEQVADELELEATAYSEQRDDVDPFPGQLRPPVVYVERPVDERLEVEEPLVVIAGSLGGRFVGT